MGHLEEHLPQWCRPQCKHEQRDTTADGGDERNLPDLQRNLGHHTRRSQPDDDQRDVDGERQPLCGTDPDAGKPGHVHQKQNRRDDGRGRGSHRQPETAEEVGTDRHQCHSAQSLDKHHTMGVHQPAGGTKQIRCKCQRSAGDRGRYDRQRERGGQEEVRAHPSRQKLPVDADETDRQRTCHDDG